MFEIWLNALSCCMWEKVAEELFEIGLNALSVGLTVTTDVSHVRLVSGGFSGSVEEQETVITPSTEARKGLDQFSFGTKIEVKYIRAPTWFMKCLKNVEVKV